MLQVEVPLREVEVVLEPGQRGLIHDWIVDNLGAEPVRLILRGPDPEVRVPWPYPVVVGERGEGRTCHVRRLDPQRSIGVPFGAYELRNVSAHPATLQFRYAVLRPRESR